MAIVLSIPCAVFAGGNDLSVEYSFDGVNYKELPSFSDGTTEYTLSLPADSKYAYIRFTAPDGCGDPTNVGYKNDFRGLSGTDLIGAGDPDVYVLGTNSGQQAQCEIPARTDDDGCYIVPIKSENATLYFTYTDENGASRDYSVAIGAKQPRLTEFNDYTTNGNNCKILFVGGAAANNDNGTITETSSRGKPSTIRALGNISKSLVGASVFMLPGLSNNDKTVGKTLFSFKADHGGKIYLLTDTKVNANTEYAKESDGWTCVNNGTAAEGIDTGSNGELLTSRAYNDYTNVDYFAWSIKWYIESYTYSSGGYNAYRLSNPGVDGDTTVDKSNNPAKGSIGGAWAMTYAYEKSFETGDLVEVPAWGHNSQDTAIFVTWKDNPLEMAYSSDGESFSAVPGFSESVYEYNISLPAGSDCAYVKFPGVEPYDMFTSWLIENNGDSFKTYITAEAVKNKSGSYPVPLKNGKGYLEFEYKLSKYRFTFTSQQATTEKFDTKNEYTAVFEKSVDYSYITFELPDGASVSVKTDEEDDALSEVSALRYKIPVIFGEGKALITYTAGGEDTLYTVNFSGPKPPNVEITMKYADDAGITFMRGSCINAANSPYLVEEDELDRTEYTFADAPSELYGASIFLLPLDELGNGNGWAASHPDEDMFVFVPNAPGTVYVMTDSEAVINSEYELLWDVENMSGKLVTKATDRQSGKTMKNESITLNKAYSYTFAKDEEVGIPVPEVANRTGNMAVIIKWDEEN